MLLRDSNQLESGMENNFKQCITRSCVFTNWSYLSLMVNYFLSLNTHRQNLLAVTFRSGEFSLQFSNLLFLFSVLLFLIGQLST